MRPPKNSAGAPIFLYLKLLPFPHFARQFCSFRVGLCSSKLHIILPKDHFRIYSPEFATRFHCTLHELAYLLIILELLERIRLATLFSGKRHEICGVFDHLLINRPFRICQMLCCCARSCTERLQNVRSCLCQFIQFCFLLRGRHLFFSESKHISNR